MKQQRRCLYCDDVLEEWQEDAHPECEDFALRAAPRICRVCGDPLPHDIDDHGLHPECVLDAWLAPGQDPFLRPPALSDPFETGTQERPDPEGPERSR